MRSKLLYLVTGIFLLSIFTQCEDSLTATTNQDEEEELPTPELVSPTNNSTNQSTQVELNWKRIKGAKEYKIQLSKSEGFESEILDSMIEGSSYTTPDLETETTYFWRVKPFKRNYEGPWSEVWQFTTSSGDVEPATVELISPDNDTVLETEMPAFEWSSVSESADYHYQLSKDADFNNLVEDSVLESTNFELVLSDSGGTYYWRVSPILDSAPSDWSEVFHFTKEETSTDSTNLTAPKPVSPSNEATGVSLQPSFEWEAVDGADYYILHANRLDPSEMVIENEVQGTTFTPDNELDTKTTHDWRVRAVSGDTKGEWSAIHRFTTGSGSGSDDSGSSTVSLISPSNGADSQSTSPSLAWESVSGINEYQVQLGTTNSFSSPIVDEAVSQTSYDVSNLDYNQTYYWRVQANGDGDSGNWSTVFSFTTKSESTSPVAGNRAGDEAALEALYAATGGSGWDNRRGWSSSGMSLSDDIYGVEVATVDGELRVVSVKLNGSTGWIRRHLEGADGREGGNNLTGQLPPEIGQLTACKYFNVKNNYLTGRVPDEIGDMERLQALYLNGRFFDFAPQDAHHSGKDHDTDERTNDFTGNFPSSVGDLTNLVYLEAAGARNWSDENIGNQGFTGPVPASLGNLRNLEGLHLPWSSFSSIPDLGNLTNMVDIAFNGNDITQPFPSWMRDMSGLRYAWLSDMGGGDNGTGFTGALPDLSGLTRLEVFDVGANSLSGDFPNYMIDGTMPNINMLIMGWNDDLSGSFGEFGDTNLAMLSVNGCSMTGEIPSSITRAERMVNLNLGYGNSFEGQFPDLSGMSQLRHVYANGNNFTGTVPMVDTNNEDLQFLHFQNNQLSEPIPSELAEVGELPRVGTNDLDVSGNPLSSGDLEAIIDALEADGNLNVLNY